MQRQNELFLQVEPDPGVYTPSIESTFTRVPVETSAPSLDDDKPLLSHATRPLETQRPPSTTPSTENRNPWRCGEAYRHPIPRSGEHWETCHKAMHRYDKEMCDAWKEEVDKLLVFAGLFSAAVTAFTVESYRWLQEGPEDISLRLLAQIAIQTQQPNSSTPFNPLSTQVLTEPFSPSPSVVRINVFWFLSLTLSLATVLVGILCMQWLREYQRDSALPHKDAMALRQMRWQGLWKWKVPMILSSLPVLLQLAVVLFFAGLLDLLWSLNRLVAVVITVAVGLIIIFLSVTTISPFLQYVLLDEKSFGVGQCAYKSPQSWAFYRLGLSVLWLVTHIIKPVSRIKWIYFNMHKLRRSFHDRNWTEYDVRQWRRLRNSDDTVDSLLWVDATFSKSVDMVHAIYYCLQDLDVTTAAQVLYSVNPDASSRLRSVMEDPSIGSTAYEKENIALSYLELHRRTHPSLTPYYLESIIRIVNSNDVRPFIDWPVRNLLKLPPDIIEQFLMCTKLMVSRDLVTPPNVIVIWALIQRLVQDLANSESGPHLARDVQLGFAIIEEIEKWLNRASHERQKMDRLSVCIYGAVKVFRPPIDFRALCLAYPECTRAASLIRTLDAALADVGNGSVILGRFVHTQWQTLVTDSSAFWT